MITKLVINLKSLRSPLTGIGYYTKNIVKECLQRNIELIGMMNGKFFHRKELNALIYSLENDYCVNKGVLSSLKNKLLRLLRVIPGIYAIEYFLVSLRAEKTLTILAKEGFTYLEPSFVPIKFNGKIITTIHDLSFLTCPAFHPKQRVNFLTKRVKKAIQISSHIIVDSNFIKNELIKHYALSDDRVSTVYLGVEQKFRIYNKHESRSTLAQLNIKDDEFILSVATLEPRKNLTMLVRAYRTLTNKLKNKYPLVLVGDFGWKNSSFFASIEDLVASGNVIVTGHIGDLQLTQLYSSAALFVYPSIYEGFGLPIIEAMASGTAVLTSHCGATAEVAGNAAFLVDPSCSQSITDGISSILSNERLRRSLQEKSMDRATFFTWSKCVDDILFIQGKLQSTVA